MFNNHIKYLGWKQPEPSGLVLWAHCQGICSWQDRLASLKGVDSYQLLNILNMLKSPASPKLIMRQKGGDSLRFEIFLAIGIYIIPSPWLSRGKYKHFPAEGNRIRTIWYPGKSERTAFTEYYIRTQPANFFSANYERYHLLIAFVFGSERVGKGTDEDNSISTATCFAALGWID